MNASQYYAGHRGSTPLVLARPPAEIGPDQELPPALADRILHASAEQMEGLPDNCVHLMVTSPPYNVTKHYDDDLSLQEYLVRGDIDWWTGGSADPDATLARVQIFEEEGQVQGFVWSNDGGFDMLVRPDRRALEQAMVEWALAALPGEGRAGRGQAYRWSTGAAGSPPATRVLRDTHEYILVFSKGTFSRPKGDRLQHHHPRGRDLCTGGQVRLDSLHPSKISVAKHRKVMTMPLYRQALDLVIEAPVDPALAPHLCRRRSCRPPALWAAYTTVWIDPVNRQAALRAGGHPPTTPAQRAGPGAAGCRDAGIAGAGRGHGLYQQQQRRFTRRQTLSGSGLFYREDQPLLDMQQIRNEARRQHMKLVPPSNRLIGSMPKIGIRPTIDGRLGGVRESLEEQTMGHGARRRRLPEREAAPRQRPAGRMRDRRQHHRRCGRGRPLRRAVPQGRRGRLAHRHPLLVLRRRNHGHGSAPAQGRLGLQRHRTAGRRLPGRRLRRPQPEGAARLQHLRPRCPGRRRRIHPR